MIGANDVFTPLGSNTLYFDDMQPGEKRSQLVSLGVDASSASGYYTLPMTLKTNGDETNYSSGIVVQATPSVILTSETSASATGLQATIKVANSGNTAIRSLYVYAEPSDSLQIEGTADKFIGTLNVDDFASFQVDLRPKQPTGAYTLPVVIQFKDNDNVDHSIRKQVQIVNPGASNMTAGASSRFQRSPEGLPVPSIVLYVVGGLLLVGVAYFGYKRWKGGAK